MKRESSIEILSQTIFCAVVVKQPKILFSSLILDLQNATKVPIRNTSLSRMVKILQEQQGMQV